MCVPVCFPVRVSLCVSLSVSLGLVSADKCLPLKSAVGSFALRTPSHLKALDVTGKGFVAVFGLFFFDWSLCFL